MQWGRLRLVMEGEESDLVIAVRTANGNAVRPSIKGGPIDQRPGTAESTDSSIRIGGHQGQPPPLSDPSVDQPTGPHIGNEVGAAEDTFEVYRGGVQYPLDAPAVWRYMPKIVFANPA